MIEIRHKSLIIFFSGFDSKIDINSSCNHSFLEEILVIHLVILKNEVSKI